jgi:acyl carrier protein
LDSLRGNNIDIRWYQSDLSEELLGAALEQVSQGMPPLRGVMHLAGVAEDGLLANLNWDSFAKVLSPKVEGSWNLHKMTEHLSLDFFVLFSSAASLSGTDGLANYASANAFEDALAYYRRDKGLPALVVNWGPWAEAGMAADLTRQKENWKSGGVTLIRPERGVELLGQLMSADALQALVLPIDWEIFANQAVRPWTSQMIIDLLPERARASKQQSPAGSAPQVTLADLAAKLSASELRVAVEGSVLSQIARVLRLPDSQTVPMNRGLTEMGMDSLMSLELKKHLEIAVGKSLPATLTFRYPTAADLVGFLAVLLENEAAKRYPKGEEEIYAV